jgi:uncharacterized membrane protein
VIVKESKEVPSFTKFEVFRVLIMNITVSWGAVYARIDTVSIPKEAILEVVSDGRVYNTSRSKTIKCFKVYSFCRASSVTPQCFENNK